MKEVLEAALAAACDQYDECVSKYNENHPLCLTLSAIKAARQMALDEECNGNTASAVRCTAYAETLLGTTNSLKVLF